jgi:hypothetical protein
MLVVYYTYSHLEFIFMSEVTLEAIANLLKSELEPINERLDTLQATVDSHTAILDAIAKSVANWQVEMTVMRDRMDKYEKVIKLLAEKLNIDVETILH